MKKKKKFENRKTIGIVIGFVIVLQVSYIFTCILVGIVVGSLIDNNTAKGDAIVEIVKNKYFEDNPKSDEERLGEFIILKDRYPGVTDLAIVDAEGNGIERYASDEKLSLVFDEYFKEGKVSKEYVIDPNDEESIQEIVENVNNFFNKDIGYEFKTWYAYKLADGNYVAIEFTNRANISDYRPFVLTFIFLTLFFVGITIYLIVSLVKTIKRENRINYALFVDPATKGNTWNVIVRQSYKNKKEDYVLACLRVEKFSSFKTFYGVEGANALLAGFFQVLKMRMAKKEVAAHISDGDFALYLKYTNEEEINERIKKLIIALENSKTDEKFYFSTGVCVCHPMDDLDDIYNNAILARGMINELSTDRIYWYNDQMHENTIWERIVERDMDRALVNKEFAVYIQPKYNPNTEELGGAEALIRWIHPEKGFIPPMKFIPIFEKNGFVVKIDDYMIEAVAKLQVEWLQAGKNPVPISVNVSRAHFSKRDLATHIASIVDSTGCPHELIELELTESAFFDDKNSLISIVKELQELGFSVSMDDFGAGYSSLNSLKELKLDIIKIDAEFFRHVDDLSRANMIVSETITLAKKLGMKIVAEGIEEINQVKFLADEGCDLIQGYYYSKPLPVEDYEKKLGI